MGTEPAAAETEQRALDERTGAGVRQDEPTISLVLHERGHARIVPLRAGLEIVVGRGEDCTIAFDDRGLSRRHAAFELGSDGRVLVRDLGSTNGTFVAGRRIDAIELAPGDEATLGAVVASLHVLRLGQARERELESHEAFRARLAAEVTRAQYFGRPLAVLMLRPLAQGAQPLRRWSIAVQQKLRPVDALAIYSDDALWALLPDAPLEEAVELARAVTVGLDLGLGCGLAVFPAAAASAEELLDLAREEARAASVEQPVRVASPEGARRVQAAGPADEGPVCESAAMRALYRTAARVARSALPVLLMAETGAGKEVLARFVHESSPRAAADMISVNCGAIAESLLESTLFGHEKGAFTGAVALHRGVFESAHQGTVFLDEVGELPLTAQAALLRVLEHGEVVRVGSTKPVPVDVRVVAATHRDLPALVAAGRFRQDLLYRLNAMTTKALVVRTGARATCRRSAPAGALVHRARHRAARPTAQVHRVPAEALP